MIIQPMGEIKFDEQMVAKKLAQLNKSKSPGPHGIHPRVLQELADVLAKPLSIIYNSFLASGVVPLAWKTANITPIYRKRDKRDPGNYHPVSLMSVASKILETIIRDHLIAHRRINKLLSNKQFGFIAGRSTTLQLISVLEE